MGFETLSSETCLTGAELREDAAQGGHPGLSSGAPGIPGARKAKSDKPGTPIGGAAPSACGEHPNSRARRLQHVLLNLLRFRGFTPSLLYLSRAAASTTPSARLFALFNAQAAQHLPVVRVAGRLKVRPNGLRPYENEPMPAS